MAVCGRWTPCHLRRKPSCEAPSRRRLLSTHNPPTSACANRVSLSAVSPLLWKTLRARWHGWLARLFSEPHSAQLARRLWQLGRAFWEDCNRSRKRLAVRLRNVVQMAVLSPGDRLDLLDVIT